MSDAPGLAAPSAAADPAGHAGRPPGLRDQLTLGLFLLIVALLFADQNLMAPSLSAIGAELGFSRAEIDRRLGADVNLVFWMLGGAVTLLVGYLTDRGDLRRLSRKRLLCAVALLGEGACLLSGRARSYDELYWARALTGIGIGGAVPLVYSLLGDYFPPRRRTSAAAAVYLAMGLGIAGGQLVSGMLSPTHGWRAPFVYVAVPGMALTALFALVGREPRRGAQEEGLARLLAEGGAYEERLRLSDLPALLRLRTNQLVFLQALPGTVPWGVFFVYLNDYYAYDKGFSVPQATLLVMAIGAAAIVGGFAGGLIGQALYNRSPRLLPLFAGACTLAGVPATALLISYPAARGGAIFGPLCIGALTGLLIAVAGPAINAMLIGVNPPEHRGAAFSLLNLGNDLGRGFGAWVVGGLAAALGRLAAFHVANLLWLFCGAMLLLCARSLPRDLAALQASLRGRAAGAP